MVVMEDAEHGSQHKRRKLLSSKAVLSPSATVQDGILNSFQIYFLFLEDKSSGYHRSYTKF
jgi:hypothetical protein